jgi:glutamine amidotransferase
VTAGLVDAMRWLAANVPIYAVNLLLSTSTDMWALRYPETNQLYLSDRRETPPDGQFHLRTKRIRAQSEYLRFRPSVVFASEPMDDDPRWRLIDSGELVHVDSGLQISRQVVLPDPPRHQLHPADLSAAAQAAQHPSAT